MTRAPRVARVVVVVGLAVLAGFLGPVPAQASCVQPPVTSPYQFAGTVTAVSNAGRTAVVRTDDGRTVTVLGTEADRPNAVTTVDRAYRVGVRYEFHPLNGTSPYRDNACTATHVIGAGSADPSGPAAAGGSDSAGGPSTSLWLGATAAAILFTGTGLWLLRRRTIRSSANHREEPNATGA